mgnify:CR=1
MVGVVSEIYTQSCIYMEYVIIRYDMLWYVIVRYRTFLYVTVSYDML